MKMMKNKYFQQTSKTKEDLDLENEVIEQIKNDSDFVEEILRPLKVSHTLFIDYLFVFSEARIEYHNCKNCPGLKDCPNSIKGMRLYPEKKLKWIDKCYEMCKLFTEQREILSCYIYHDFSEKFDDMCFKNLKNYKNGNRQQLKIALKEKIKNKNKEWLFIYGPKNSSKTEFLATYANEYAINKNGKIAYVDIHNALDFVKENFYKNNDEVKEYMDTLSSVNLLVFDGIDKEMIMNNILRNQFLWPIIKFRSDNNLETAFGSRMNLDELTDTLAMNKFGLENALEITKTIHDKLYRKQFYLEHLIL